MNPIRKIIQKIGFDFHRYRPGPDRGRLWSDLGINTVLDIGANTGQFASEIRHMLPESQIYSFEPLKDCFETLRHRFEGDPKFQAFHHALGEKPSQLTMNKSVYSPSSSILKMSSNHKKLFPHTKEHTTETVEIKRLDDIANNLNLKKEILIKVDVQGFEDKVIAGGEKTFRHAAAIIMETSFIELYENQPSFDLIYEKLKSIGFKYSGSLQQKSDRHTGTIISEDSMFLR